MQTEKCPLCKGAGGYGQSPDGYKFPCIHCRGTGLIDDGRKKFHESDKLALIKIWIKDLFLKTEGENEENQAYEELMNQLSKIESDVVGLNDWVRESYDRAERKGFHEPKRSVPEALCLIHSEVSEALEDYREGRMETYFDENGKPCGFPSELADVLIRLFDTAGELGIDLETEVRIKSNYNETRAFKHGGKKI